MAPILYNLIFSATAGLGLLTGCATGAEVDPAVAMQIADPDAQLPPAAAPQQADPAVVALLEKIEAASSKIETLKARVRYTRLQGATGDEQRRFGDLYYTAASDDAPTLFAVLFDRLVVDNRARPMETWFIFDGNWLLERDHKDKSAVRRELVPKGAERSDVLSLGDGQMPIPLRLKAEEVLKTYRVTRLKDEPFGETQILVHLKLSPKQANADVDPLELWFDKETLALHKVVTTEDGDDIEMLLTLSEPNAQIEAAVFKTTLPSKQKGWQVQEVPIKR